MSFGSIDGASGDVGGVSTSRSCTPIVSSAVVPISSDSTVAAAAATGIPPTRTHTHTHTHTHRKEEARKCCQLMAGR